MISMETPTASWRSGNSHSSNLYILYSIHVSDLAVICEFSKADISIPWFHFCPVCVNSLDFSLCMKEYWISLPISNKKSLTVFYIFSNCAEDLGGLAPTFLLLTVSLTFHSECSLFFSEVLMQADINAPRDSPPPS